MTTYIPTWIGEDLHPVEKMDAHERGLRHQAVSIFVLCGDEMLIQQRAPGKYHTPELWANSCCTHPNWNEKPEDCAARRLGEELGITGVAPEHVGQVEYRADVGNDMVEHEVVEVYVLRLSDKPDLSPDPEEVMDTRWITLSDLQAEIAAEPDKFTPWVRIYLADHVGMIMGEDAA
jgi:isopentenyl-diphosphate Delta-isomerase